MNMQVFFNCPHCGVLMERHRMISRIGRIEFKDHCYNCQKQYILTVDLEKGEAREKTADDRGKHERT